MMMGEVENSWRLVKNQNNYSKSKNVNKMPKKLQMSSLKIQKGSGVLKKTKKLPE